MNRRYIKEKIIELAAYYGKDMTPATLDIYADHLEDMAQEAFDLAIERHIETSEWMPKVSQIREAAMLNFLKKAGVPSPAEAWGEVSKHLRSDRQESYGTLTAVNRIDDHDFTHPIVKRAAEQIGWLDLWLTRDSNATANRARYMDAYRELVEDLKNHYQLNPDLQKAIEPAARPLLQKPKREALPERAEQGEFVPMPDRVRARLEKLKQKKEA